MGSTQVCVETCPEIIALEEKLETMQNVIIKKLISDEIEVRIQ